MQIFVHVTLHECPLPFPRLTSKARHDVKTTFHLPFSNTIPHKKELQEVFSQRKGTFAFQRMRLSWSAIFRGSQHKRALTSVRQRHCKDVFAFGPKRYYAQTEKSLCSRRYSFIFQIQTAVNLIWLKTYTCKLVSVYKRKMYQIQQQLLWQGLVCVLGKSVCECDAA